MLDNIVARFHDIKAKRERGEGGFTLIELLVVVVIIGILIAIAIPLYLNYQKGAKDKSAQSDLRGAVSAVNQCYTDNSNTYPDSITFASNVGTPSATACASDKINTSDGTTMVYSVLPAGATGSAITGFKLTSYNSGGNRGTSNPYSYDSTVGGKVG